MHGIFQYQNGEILTSPHCGLKLNCVICTAVNFIARTYQLNTLYVHNFIEIHSWMYSTVQIWLFYSKLMTKLPWSKILISVNAKYTCNLKCVYPSRSTNLKKFIPHLCKNFKSSPYMCDCPDYRGPGSESQRSIRILVKKTKSIKLSKNKLRSFLHQFRMELCAISLKWNPSFPEPLLYHPESNEWFIEDQGFLRLYDSAPRPPPSPVSNLSHFLIVWCRSILLTEEGGRGWGRSKIDRKKAWSSINLSILSGLTGQLFCE